MRLANLFTTMFGILLLGISTSLWASTAINDKLAVVDPVLKKQANRQIEREATTTYDRGDGTGTVIGNDENITVEQ